MQPLATREEYWGNNYLPRNDPAAFDILYWNSDTTRLPAALHSVYPDLYHNSPLLRPGALRLLGTLIDLGKVQCDTFILAAMMDHVTPWQACCATTRMLGGQKEFVLSSSGHIQSVITLGNPKAKFLRNPKPAADSWFAAAQPQPGSWWDHWRDWLVARSGQQSPAPVTLGSRRPRAKGPGTYVFEP